MARSKAAIFLSGPIGAGKSTLGIALAGSLRGIFIEGDEHSLPDKPWYASSLSTSRSIARSILTDAAGGRPVVIAYPLRCIEWVFYRRRLAEHGIQAIVVSLGASFDSIVSPSRGRRFSREERVRIRQMIEQGYGQRGFSDLIFRTGRETEAETLSRLVAELSIVLPLDN